MAKNISDEDRARARARARRMTTNESANPISNRDAQILEEAGRARDLRKARKAFQSLIPLSLKSPQSANPISNRDVQILEEAYMKRNDGGMAMSGRGKPVRTF
jgi:hypothetical protein